MATPAPRRVPPANTPLDPAVARLIDALAKAQARDDHEREEAAAQASSSRPAA